MVKKTKKKLGKGLSALLGSDKGPIKAVVDQNATTSSGLITADRVLPVHNIYPGRFQPRQEFSAPEIRELSDSIKAHGVIQPILVRKHRTKSDSFEIIAGERRWRAAQLAKLHEIPVIFKEFSDAEALEIGLVENLQRENLLRANKLCHKDYFLLACIPGNVIHYSQILWNGLLSLFQTAFQHKKTLLFYYNSL